MSTTRAVELQLDSNYFSLNIVSLSIDEDLFAPKLVVTSDIIFTHESKSENRRLLFVVERKEDIEASYLSHLDEILPFVFNALYSLDTEPNRLYVATSSPLSAKREDGINPIGRRFVVTDYHNKILSSYLVTSLNKEFMFLTPLWADQEIVRYMKISPTPFPSLSILFPFNLNSLSLQTLVDLFPIWGVVRVESGLKGVFDFTSSSISLLAQVGFKGILPSSIFFSNDVSHKWYSHFAIIARTLFSIGMYIDNGLNFMYESSISLNLQYHIHASLSLSIGGGVDYTTIMPTQNVSIDKTKAQVVIGLTKVW